MEYAMFAKTSKGPEMKNLRIREEPGDFHCVPESLVVDITDYGIAANKDHTLNSKPRQRLPHRIGILEQYSHRWNLRTIHDYNLHPSTVGLR
jgi:hypothetical protein